MKLFPKFIITGLFLFLIIPVSNTFAQTSTLSPYSRFGPGDLLFNGFAHQQGMGGTSIAGNSVSRLNFTNPSSYAFDTLMVLEFGITTLAERQTQNEAHHTQVNPNMDYLALGFPVVRGKWGMSFGIIPYSGSGYKVATTNTLSDSAGNYTSRFNGTGGFTRYYLGNGFKLNKHFSIGANASYLYGTVNRIRRVEFTNTNFFDTQYQDGLTMNDFYFELGANYNVKLNDKYDFAVGFTASPAQGLRSKNTMLYQNFVIQYGVDYVKDTVDHYENKKGITKMPLSLGLGFQLAKTNKWSAGLDINYQDWSNYKAFGRVDTLSNSFSVSLGGQMTPDLKGDYAHRTQYRAGMYYHKTFLDLNNTALNDIGVSVGIGMPLRKAYQSMINIALQVGQRGTTSNDLISERYIRLSIGLTFNEDWFRKRKFD